MHAKGLIEVSNEKPNWPQQFKSEANDEIQRDAPQPHHNEFQVHQVVEAKESKKVL